MYPAPFDYVAPGDLDEAIGALAATGGARVLAGGMSLLGLMKLRRVSPSLLVDLRRVPGLDRIEDRGDHVAIGAMVTHGATATDPLVRRHAAALASAAAWTGDVQVRNQGTTCGALAHADPAGDQPAAAIACGATMVAVSGEGVRHIPADRFFATADGGEGRTALRTGEILVEVRLPKPGGASAYDKLGRRRGRSGYPIAGAAVRVATEDGVVTAVSAAVTGIADRPVPVTGVEAIVGSDGTPATVAPVLERAVGEVSVVDDLYGSGEYKTHVAQVYLGRALERALRGSPGRREGM